MFPSSSLCNGYFTRYILLCSLFLISIDLRMPLVSHGLLNSFFCLFDTFWGGAQKFINFSTFLRNSSEINRHHCDLNAALLLSQHFLVESLLCFYFFQSLGSLGTFALCFQTQMSCVDFLWSKTEHDGLTMC